MIPPPAEFPLPAAGLPPQAHGGRSPVGARHHPWRPALVARLLAFVSLLWLCAGLSPASAINILPNPGAESGTDPAADFWVNSWGAAQAVTNPALAHTGNRAWECIAGTGTEGARITSDFASGGQVTQVDVGETFTFSAWVKAPNASPTRQIKVRLRYGFYDASGGAWSSVQGFTDFYLKDTNWTQLTAPAITCPGDGVFLATRVYGYNAYRETDGGPDVADVDDTNFPVYIDDLVADSPDYQFAVVSGTVTDGGSGVAGAIVAATQTGNGQASASPPTDAAGNYSVSCRVGREYQLSASSLPVGKLVATAPAPFTPADTAPITGKNITLGTNPDYDPDLLFSIRSSDASASAPWPCVNPAGSTLARMGSPGVEMIGSQQWERNVYTTYDGYTFGGVFNDPIPVNGASVVAVVQPEYRVDGGWGCVFNAFYNDLSLNVNQVNGRIAVFRNGYSFDGPVLLDGQKAVLSLVVQPDGQFKLFVNGTESMNVTGLSAYTQMSPGGWNWNNGLPAALGFAHNINVGRNAPDGWSTYNGRLGDLSVFKIALDDVRRAAMETALMTKFSITTTMFNILATAGPGGSISPAGSVPVLSETDKTFTITPATGYAISDVTVTENGSTESKGAVGSYTFTNIAMDGAIDASFEALPTGLVSGAVTLPGGAGSTVYFKPTADAASSPFMTATTGPDGSYSLALPIGHWYVAAGAVGYDVSADTQIDVTTGGLSGVNFALVANPNWDVMFIATVDGFSGLSDGDLTGNWIPDYPAGASLNALATPRIATVDGVNMVEIDRDDTIGNDGYQLAGTTLLNGVEASGVSVVAVVQPAYTPIGGETRGEFVNLYYNGLSFAINHNNGEVIVCRKGNWTFSTGAFIPNGQKTVLSLVCQLDGSAKLYANGSEVWSGGALGGNYFARLEGTDMNWMRNIGVGRNPWDGWSSFNGNLGDVYVYRRAIDDADRVALQESLMSKFGIVLHTITATAGPGGSINPAGEVQVVEGFSQAFVIAPDYGSAVADVLVDGASVGAVTSYLFDNVTAPHTIAVSFQQSVLGYDDWTYYYAFLTNPDAERPANPDGDSLPNFAEYALDDDPLSTAASGKMRSVVEDVNGQQALLMTFPVLTGATFSGTTSQSASIGGVTYVVEGSNDLASFGQVVTEVVPARTAGLPGLTVEGPAGWTYRTFRLSGAVPARGSKGFLRVRVTNDIP